MLVCYIQFMFFWGGAKEEAIINVNKGADVCKDFYQNHDKICVHDEGCGNSPSHPPCRGTNKVLYFVVSMHEMNTKRVGH